MMAMGAIEFLTAFSIRPALDVVLNPQSTAQKLTLFQIPWNGHTVYLNSFVPTRIHHVWSVFAVALVSLFFMKGLAEYFGGSLIEYVGLSAITDLRNQVYAKLVQQPVGFFHHNPVGRVMSAVISDVEQLRAVFSDYLVDFFRQIFSLVAFIVRIARGRLANGDWRCGADSAGALPGGKIWPQDSQFVATEPFAAGRPEPDLAGNDQRQPRGEGVRDGRIRNPQIPRGFPQTAARKYALGARVPDDFAADGFARRGRCSA